MPLHERVVSLYPTSHGFGFAAFEADNTLVDWGHVHVRPARHDKCLEKMWDTLSWYAPSVIALEDTKDSDSRRGERVTKLLDALGRMAEKTARVRVVKVSRGTVRTAFDPQGKVTKQQIAEIVAAYYTELRFQVPPPRKIWMSEAERMSIFSAVAMAMTVMYGAVYEGEVT